MTEQQKKAVEEAAKEYALKAHQSINDIGVSDIKALVYDYMSGMHQVLNNPSKYGLQPINEWVSVEDRLPEKHETVMILEWIEGLSEPCVLMGSFEGNRWRIYGGHTADKVTHWQYRPQPPINEREEG